MTSHDFKNVGKVIARRLLNEFGPEELLNMLRNRSFDRMRTIKSVNDRVIAGLERGAMVLFKKLELAEYLDNIGLEAPEVHKIFDIWGTQAISKIKRNPYILLCVLPWDKIDQLGLLLGPADHRCRLVGAVEQCHYEDYERGKNTCIPPSLLKAKICELLRCSEEVAERAIQHALDIGAVVKHGKVLQIPAAYSFERQIELFLKHNQTYNISAREVTNYIRSGEFRDLTDEQISVVVNVLQNRFSAFHGRGGRGKTYVLRAICAAAVDKVLMGGQGKTLQPILCAVAAKACQRMKMTTGVEAFTIARVLYKIPRPALESKIIIVDEASMLSLSDAYHLVKKIPDTSRIVFLGDPGQIPSVDAGRVLYDIISSGVVPTVELTNNLRQDQKTDTQLELILGGTFPELEDYWVGAQTGLYRSVVDSVFAAEEEALRLYGLFNGNAQIISPRKVNVGGSKSINNLIHHNLYGQNGYVPNTPVVTKSLTVKTSNRGGIVSLTNGSIGVVKSILTQAPRYDEQYLVVDFELEGEVTLTFGEVNEYLEKAYCLTCHKAQGSEWDNVIIVLPESQLVDRNTVYSALSRCKKRAIIVYHNHNYVVNAVRGLPAHERRRTSLFGD